MKRVGALFWSLAAKWLDTKGLAQVAEKTLELAGSEGGKIGASALLQLAERLLAKGELEEALAACQESLRNDPDNADAWCCLGIIQRQSGLREEARHSYEHALEIDRSHLLALSHLGEWHLATGSPDVALGYLEDVLRRSPLFPEALGFRVKALVESDKLPEAEQAAGHALENHPERADFHANLGMVLIRKGDRQGAVLAYRKALEIEPAHKIALFNLAVLEKNPWRLQDWDSAGFLRRKIAMEGESAYLEGLLGSTLVITNKLAEAKRVLLGLVEKHPENVRAWTVLAECVTRMGDADRGVEYYRKAIELQPEGPDTYSYLAFTETYLNDRTRESIFASHLEWAECLDKNLHGKKFTHIPADDPEKKLRIGYVSGDFCSHPAGHLLRGVLQEHDHEKFEIHCFSASSFSDNLTNTLRSLSDYWHEIASISDDEFAKLVNTLEIDIMIDLSGHTLHNRLPAFALKPAPIEATWIGYFHSTGLSSIDYFISDRYTTPDPAKQCFSETPVRLPHSRFCFVPCNDAPEVSEPPYQRTAYVTFGSFNRLPKLSPKVIDAWSRIVMSVPDSRLIIKSAELSDAETAERMKEKFAAAGLSAERLLLRPGSSYLQMFEEYADIDIALDTFPFNGGMTTFDALWMGVPVVALEGTSVVSRQSTSILCNLGLEELIFPDVESYIAGAVALANDRDRLAELRTIMRPRMSRSSLCDAEQFTQDLETLYQRMWQAWCRGEKIGPAIVPGKPVARKITRPVTNHAGTDKQLLGILQRRWEAAPLPHNGAIRRVESIATANMIEIVGATRLTEIDFWTKSALGISLRRLAGDSRLVPNIAFENRRGLPEIYNERIKCDEGPDILAFVHDDVWFDDAFIANRVLDGLKKFDVIGVAGNRRRLPGQPAWSFVDEDLTWDIGNLSGSAGHDQHPFGAISVYGDAPAECELLDGVFLATRKSVLKDKKVSFDPSFAFNFYDMDFCLTARSKGLHLGTWPIAITHQSGGKFGSPEWQETLALYRKKWGN